MRSLVGWKIENREYSEGRRPWADPDRESLLFTRVVAEA